MASDFVLPENYRNIPLEALRISARRKLSLYLNLERLPNETMLVPDFNGLAEQIGFGLLEIQNFGRQGVRDPTTEVLNEWTRRPDMEPTVGRLFEFLLKMGREDVLTDCRPIILSDIEHYLSQRKRTNNSVAPVQDNAISQSSGEGGTDHDEDEFRCMTIMDVETGQETFYDAFICYDPNGYDLQFVKRMLEELESRKYGLRLFVPWRDDLPGTSAHTISARLIQYRCRRMVIIMSPRFLTSPACDFQTKYAHSLSPGSRSKKLVPVLITPCDIPQILRHVTLCDFTKRDLMEWFWVRLARAIKAPLNFTELKVSKKMLMDNITLDVNLEQYGEMNHSSSETLPIIHASSPLNPAAQAPSGTAASGGGSPMDHPESAARSSATGDLAGGLGTARMAGSPGAARISRSGSPVPPTRRHRTSDKSIPQLFPSSQC